MVHSPTLITAGTRRVSPSPSHVAPTLSKRDKKRQQVEQRIKDIETSFFKDRDFHLRNHLGSVNRDIHYVNRANPYANRPLDDFIDDTISDVVSQPSVAGSIDGENRQPLLGKFSQQFVDAVNDAMEERDARIAETSNKFDAKLETYKTELFFSLETAEAEHRALMAAVREKMISSVENKKRLLKKEKEMLDGADYSTLTNNGLTLIQPSSPGGAHTQRRTRHTRRQDHEVIDVNEGSRKKRKTLAEPDAGSPNPTGSRSRHDMLTSALWDKQDSSASSTSASEAKVERYFSTKDLSGFNKRAREEIATNWVNRTRPRHSVNGHSIRLNGEVNGDHPTVNGGDDSDEMEADMHPSLLMAPAMDRTGSSHATRSTRALYTNPETSLVHIEPSELGRLAAQPLTNEDARKNYGSAILAAQAQRSNMKETTKDLEIPHTTGMTAQEQHDDWQYICSL